jgi:hypothetical protein
MEVRSSRRMRTLVTQMVRSRPVHDGPEQMLQSEAGYIDATPLTTRSTKFLQRTAGPYIGSQAAMAPHVRFTVNSGRSSRLQHCSALGPEAVIARRQVGRGWNVPSERVSKGSLGIKSIQPLAWEAVPNVLTSCKD